MNTTPASSYIRTLTSATKLVAPLVVTACLALAAAPARGADRAWAPTGDAPWLWNTTTANFLDGVNPATWDNTATNKVAVFGVVPQRTVTVGSPIELQQMRFTASDYLLQAGSNGTLAFTESSPSLVIADGVTTTIDVQLSSVNPLTLAGSGIFQLRGVGFVTENVIADTTAINLDGVTMNLAGRSETVGGFTLSDGSIRNGSLTADSYDLKNGLVDVDLDVGTVTVMADAKTVTFGAAGRLNSSNILNVAGGTLNLGDNDQSVYRVKLTGGEITGTGLLSSSNSFWLENGIVSTQLSGKGKLSKETSGAVTLTRDNSYTGSTTINSGTLQLAMGSSIAASSQVTVNSGGILAGDGSALGPVLVNRGGTLAPGMNGVGTLHTGSQTWSAGGIYRWDIASVSPLESNLRDLLSINGGLTINSASNDRFILLVNNLNGAVPDANASYSWALATTTATLSNFSDLTNRFQINLPTAWNSIALDRFSITQDVNTIYLTMAVPEPKDYAMILGAITLGLVGYRRWRRTAQFA